MIHRCTKAVRDRSEVVPINPLLVTLGLVLKVQKRWIPGTKPGITIRVWT